MDKQLHLYLMDDEGNDYMLSLAYTDGEHSITLLKAYDDRGNAYVTQGKPFYTDDLDEYFQVIHDAHDGEFSIFLNQYTVDLNDTVDNDNKPTLRLVDNDWPVDRADD